MRKLLKRLFGIMILASLLVLLFFVAKVPILYFLRILAISVALTIAIGYAISLIIDS